MTLWPMRTQLNAMKLLFSLLLLGFLHGPPAQAQANAPADALLGRWYVPSRQSTVEFFKKGNRYFARISELGGGWEKNYAHTKGKILLTNLQFTGDEWAGGEVIHPASGLRFDAALTLKNPNTIRAIAYKGARFLHREFIMVRQAPPSESLTGK
jgi:uncharacterized protein (DUF2147 family)